VGVLVAQHRNRALSLDPLGALWAVVALTGLVYGVIEAPQVGWTSWETLTALGVGAAGLIGFVLHELRSVAPSLDVRLFLDRGLACGSLLVSLQFFASLGLFVLAPQYLQVVRDLSPLQAAAALLVIPVGVGAGTALAPGLLSRVGPRPPGAGGLAAMAGGFAVLALAIAEVDSTGALVRWWLPAVGLLAFGFGFGLAITPGTVLIIDGLPEDRRSVASAVNDITREVGGVLGIAVLSSVLISAYRDDITGALAALPPQVQGRRWTARPRLWQWRPAWDRTGPASRRPPARPSPPAWPPPCGSEPGSWQPQQRSAPCWRPDARRTADSRRPPGRAAVNSPADQS
jgi:hypothetical protein